MMQHFDSTECRLLSFPNELIFEIASLLHPNDVFAFLTLFKTKFINIQSHSALYDPSPSSISLNVSDRLPNALEIFNLPNWFYVKNLENARLMLKYSRNLQVKYPPDELDWNFKSLQWTKLGTNYILCFFREYGFTFRRLSMFHERNHHPYYCECDGWYHFSPEDYGLFARDAMERFIETTNFMEYYKINKDENEFILSTACALNM